MQEGVPVCTPKDEDAGLFFVLAHFEHPSLLQSSLQRTEPSQNSLESVKKKKENHITVPEKAASFKEVKLSSGFPELQS